MSGTYIPQNLHTSECAKDMAYEFLFVLGPARFTAACRE
jgi:hypothetical protein